MMIVDSCRVLVKLGIVTVPGIRYIIVFINIDLVDSSVVEYTLGVPKVSRPKLSHGNFFSRVAVT